MIGSKTGGIPDAIVDGITGLLVDPYNTKEIAQAVISLLNDEQLALILGKNGRTRVENELTWLVTGKRIVASLQNLKSSAKYEQLQHNV